MTRSTIVCLLSSPILLLAPSGGHAQGMPEESRVVIQALFENHQKIERVVKKTPEGYQSTTTSDDPAVAKLLRQHVAQMEKRLEAGMRVRRWDPAFAEFVDHYDDMEITITGIEKGVRIVAEGKTEAARKVARNHAGIITAFVKKGHAEAHQKHPAVSP